MPAVTTSRIIARSAVTESALSAVPLAGGFGPDGAAGPPAGASVNSFGCCQDPRATAAAAPASTSGLTRVWP